MPRCLTQVPLGTGSAGAPSRQLSRLLPHDCPSPTTPPPSPFPLSPAQRGAHLAPRPGGTSTSTPLRATSMDPVWASPAASPLDAALATQHSSPSLRRLSSSSSSHHHRAAHRPQPDGMLISRSLQQLLAPEGSHGSLDSGRGGTSGWQGRQDGLTPLGASSHSVASRGLSESLRSLLLQPDAPPLLDYPSGSSGGGASGAATAAAQALLLEPQPTASAAGRRDLMEGNALQLAVQAAASAARHYQALLQTVSSPGGGAPGAGAGGASPDAPAERAQQEEVGPARSPLGRSTSASSQRHSSGPSQHHPRRASRLMEGEPASVHGRTSPSASSPLGALLPSSAVHRAAQHCSSSAAEIRGSARQPAHDWAGPARANSALVLVDTDEAPLVAQLTAKVLGDATSSAAGASSAAGSSADTLPGAAPSPVDAHTAEQEAPAASSCPVATAPSASGPAPLEPMGSLLSSPAAADQSSPAEPSWHAPASGSPSPSVASFGAPDLQPPPATGEASPSAASAPPSSLEPAPSPSGAASNGAPAAASPSTSAASAEAGAPPSTQPAVASSPPPPPQQQQQQQQPAISTTTANAIVAEIRAVRAALPASLMSAIAAELAAGQRDPPSARPHRQQLQQLAELLARLDRLVPKQAPAAAQGSKQAVALKLQALQHTVLTWASPVLVPLGLIPPASPAPGAQPAAAAAPQQTAKAPGEEPAAAAGKGPVRRDVSSRRVSIDVQQGVCGAPAAAAGRGGSGSHVAVGECGAAAESTAAAAGGQAPATSGGTPAPARAPAGRPGEASWSFPVVAREGRADGQLARGGAASPAQQPAAARAQLIASSPGPGAPLPGPGDDDHAHHEQPNELPVQQQQQTIPAVWRQQQQQQEEGGPPLVSTPFATPLGSGLTPQPPSQAAAPAVVSGALVKPAAMSLAELAAQLNMRTLQQQHMAAAALAAQRSGAAGGSLPSSPSAAAALAASTALFPVVPPPPSPPPPPQQQQQHRLATSSSVPVAAAVGRAPGGVSAAGEHSGMDLAARAMSVGGGGTAAAALAPAPSKKSGGGSFKRALKKLFSSGGGAAPGHL